jgi:hypothetical protein
MKNDTKHWSERLMRRGNSKELDVVGRIILDWIVGK